MKYELRVPFGVGLPLLLVLVLLGPMALAQEDPLILFGVVTKVPKDRRQVTAQVSTGGPPTETTLIAGDTILDNPIWKKLEVCQALRAEAWKNPEGYRIVSVRILDPGMLPMSLQGLAGDCLLKRALEFAPPVD